MRRWRYPHRMQCVLCAGKHFGAGSTRLRRVALFFLDDATRFGLDVVVGISGSTVLFLGGLCDLVTKHGLPDLLYLDRGPGFISGDTLAVVEGGLGAWLIHGRRRYPQGHGVLDRYDKTPHETLDGDTPQQRWEQGRALRFPDDEADLYRRFVVRELHKVSADHVVKARVPLPHGRSGPGYEAALDLRRFHEGRVARGPQADPPPAAAPVRYTVMSNHIPENWIPLVPVHVPGDNRTIQLQRAALPRVIEGDPDPRVKIRPRSWCSTTPPSSSGSTCSTTASRSGPGTRVRAPGFSWTPADGTTTWRPPGSSSGGGRANGSARERSVVEAATVRRLLETIELVWRAWTRPEHVEQ